MPFCRKQWPSRFAALEIPASAVVGRDEAGGVLILANSVLHQAHFLIGNGHLIVRVVVAILGRVGFAAFEAEFRAYLVDADGVGRDTFLNDDLGHLFGGPLGADHRTQASKLRPVAVLMRELG